MPPRISRVSAPNGKSRSAKPRTRAPKKSAKRALDAFSIASHEHGDRIKIAKHRLGESDVTSHRHKRPRDEEEDEDEDEEEPKRRKQKGGDSADEGSDSEGNTWTMGHVEDDDDSDIDSDEAFGESDEERFEGWVFRGSSSAQDKVGRSKKGKRVGEDDDDVDMNGEFDLNEDEGESADEEEEDEDDLGEDAIDLATALDQYEESEDEEETDKPKEGQGNFDSSDSEPSEEEDLAADGASDFATSDEDEEEEDDIEKVARLQDLISSLPEDQDRNKGPRRPEVHESGAPSEFGVMRKVDLASFKSRNSNPEKKKSLKLLQDDPKPSKRNDIARKLDAPLPKRQQDRLDRFVANEKANETLGRWVDTVKQNRRAEHLSFPLVHPDQGGDSIGANQLMPTTTAAPVNDLESTIQSILQQSGLSNGKDDEEQIQKWEELQTNKLPLEEVAARRAQLRKERELLFREEIRAKRIKKIKSKAFRRVHRKERERTEQREKDALRADGVDVSEDERDYNDRRRAEERMGAKHRESKWAKSVKQSGKAAWDEDARAGVTEMARRNEELRRRIEGKNVRNDDEEGSDFSSDGEEDEELDDKDGDQVLQQQLGRLKQNPFSTDNTKLGSMAFMQKAEAARRARNDEDIERMRRELAGEESHSDEEDENATRAGRRKFGPSDKIAAPAIQIKRSEFEERPASDDEAENEPVDIEHIKTLDDGSSNGVSNGTSKASNSVRSTQNVPSAKTTTATQNPYLMKAPKEKKSKERPVAAKSSQIIIAPAQQQPKAKPKSKKSSKVDESPEPQVSAPDADGWQTVTYNHDSDSDSNDSDISNEGIDLSLVNRNRALTSQAFAGDNIAQTFALEKEAQAASEDEQTTQDTLPGWGAWVGDALPKRSARHRKPLTIINHKEGVKRDKRKDKGLERVIINEKKVKKNNKYLASRLPHEFETKEQYERSLRLPKGREWVTKQTLKEGTMPRLLVKQGVIRPLDRPMV